MKYTLKELGEKYELELDRVVSEIEEEKAKSVLIQLPDGLKPWGTCLADYLSEKVGKDVEIRIWLGECFGACDLPESDCDLIVQFGHAEW